MHLPLAKLVHILNVSLEAFYEENILCLIGGLIGTDCFLFQQTGLRNVRAFSFLVLWYIFSAFTLFLNKYILSTLRGDPMLLGKCGGVLAWASVVTCVCV